jgi:hypothetical protein
MARILYHNNPTAASGVIEVINLISKFLPSWAHTLNVVFQEESEDNAIIANIECMSEYRSVTVYIFPRMLLLSTEEQYLHLIHEMVHVLIWDITKEHTDIVSVIEKKGGYTDYMKSVFESRVEGCTQDIAELFNKIKFLI